MSGRSTGKREGIPAATEGDAGDRRSRVYRGETLHARRVDQRDRIFDAARHVFSTTGYANASIDEIVALARVSRTSFYRFFENKEDCMLAVYEDAIEGLALAFVRAAEAERPDERIRLGVAGVIRGLAADPEVARVVLVEAVGASPRIEQARVNARITFTGLLAAELRRYPGWRDRPEAEIEVVALATMAAIAETVGALVADDRASEWKQLIEPLTRFAMRALTPEGERPPV
jgi:AcrR family transcriptional regulator